MNYVASFAWGEVFAEYPQCVNYGLKHASRFGPLKNVRKATEDDPCDEFRLVYTLNENSPARQRYLKRRHDRAHPAQPVLFAGMFKPTNGGL